MRNKIFLAAFFIIAFGGFFAVLFNLDFLESSLRDGIAGWGILAVFILSLIVELLEQPIGPEVPAGFAVALGLSFPLVLLASSIGNFIGSLVSFYIGRNFLAYRIQRVCSVKKHGNYCRFFSKHGRIALFVAAISPVPYVLFCWLSGAFYMKVRDFIIFGSIPRTFRILTVMAFVRFIF